MSAEVVEDHEVEDLAFGLLASVVADLDRATRSDVTSLLSYGEPGSALDALLYAIDEGHLAAPAALVTEARRATA